MIKEVNIMDNDDIKTDLDTEEKEEGAEPAMGTGEEMPAEETPAEETPA